MLEEKTEIENARGKTEIENARGKTEIENAGEENRDKK